MLQDDKALELIRQLVKEARLEYNTKVLTEGRKTPEAIVETINEKELAEKQELKEFVTRNIVKLIKDSGD
jgi:hypothetical protein